MPGSISSSNLTFDAISVKHHWKCKPTNSFVIFTNQMFGSLQKSVEQKPLKDANFPSVYVYVYICMYVWICLHTSGGRCAKTELSSYGSCETENKWCGTCILTTKRVTQTNYYDNSYSDSDPSFTRMKKGNTYFETLDITFQILRRHLLPNGDPAPFHGCILSAINSFVDCKKLRTPVFICFGEFSKFGRIG